MNVGRRLSFFAQLIIVAFGLLAYVNSVPNSFVWDDTLLVTGNPDIRSLRNIPRLFISGPFSAIGGNFYRPVQFISYAIDHSFWGLNPFGYHLTNMLIHIANAALVYVLFSTLTGRRKAAFAAALVFVVHPINTEAVTYISGRADLLAAFFMYSSLLLLCSDTSFSSSPRPPTGGEGRVREFLSLLFFALSLLSKEAALALPLLALLCLFAYRAGETTGGDGQAPGSGSSRHFSAGVLILFLTSLAYLIVRAFLRATGVEYSPPGPYSFAMRFLTSFKVILMYLRLLALPYPLTMERIVPMESSLFSTAAVLSLLAVLTILACAVAVRRRAPVVSFGIAWFFIALLPYMNWFPLNAEMAEHWLYIPSVGIFLLVAIALERVAPGWVFHIALAAILACLSCLTIARNLDWRDEETIYTVTTVRSPGSPRARYNMGNVYLKKGQVHEAAAEYREALRLKPWDAPSHKNLGNALLQLGRTGEAISEFETAVWLEPRSADAHTKLGAAYGMSGMNERAVTVLETAVRLDPKNPDARNNLASVYTNMGRFEEARKEYELLIRERPGMLEANFNLGIVYYNLGEREKARSQFRKTLAIRPAFAPAMRWLENMGEQASGHGSP